MICPKCDRENRPEAKFCDSCGAKLGHASDKSVAPFMDSIADSGLTQSGIGVGPNRAVPGIAEDLFVGRHAEMEELRATLHSTVSGRGRLVMLVGEPGAGKTRTSLQLAEYAAREGAQVLWGRCYENPGAPPYWPWVQIIRAYLHQTEADVVRQTIGAGGPNVAEIVPELRDWLPEIEPSAALEDPDQARFRLFDSITNFLKLTAEQQPIVLFLDNLHLPSPLSVLP